MNFRGTLGEDGRVLNSTLGTSSETFTQATWKFRPVKIQQKAVFRQGKT